MTQTEIQSILKNSEENSFRFDFETLTADFLWEEERSQIFETVNIDYVVLERDQIESLLDDNDAETFNWEGTVIERNDEEVSDPAFGGESNTDGVPEKGSIFVELSDLDCSSMIEY